LQHNTNRKSSDILLVHLTIVAFMTMITIRAHKTTCSYHRNTVNGLQQQSAGLAIMADQSRSDDSDHTCSCTLLAPLADYCLTYNKHQMDIILDVLGPLTSTVCNRRAANPKQP